MPKFILNKAEGTAEDLYGHKLSFYIDKNEVKVDKILKQYKKDLTGKPLLQGYKPAHLIDTSKISRKNEDSIFFSKEVDSYMREMQKNIKNNWSPNVVKNNKPVTVLFYLDKHGNITDAKIYKSSGNKESDYAALKAINSSSPLPPFPHVLELTEEFKTKNVISIYFTFNSGVFNN